MYAAARALPGSAALPRTTSMRQRGTFTHYMHAAARALSLFHSQGRAAAPGHVGGDGLPDCTRVRVCWSLFEFVGVCRVCVELGGPCPAQPRQSCQPLCQPLRQPLCQSLCQFLSTACAHTPTREVALVALVFLSVHHALQRKLWRLFSGGGLEGHRPRARAPGDPGHARTSLRQVHRDLSTSTSRRRGGPGDGTDRSLAGGRALLQGSTDARAAACT